VCRRCRRRTPRGAQRAPWGTFGLRHAGWRSWPAAIALGFVAVFAVPFGVADLRGSAHFIDWSSIDVPKAAVSLVVRLALMTMMALTEEMGWRSYLLHRTQMLLPRRRSAVAVGFVHGLFHLPLILLTSTYDSIGNRWVVAPLVLLSGTAAGVFYAWLKDRSGSGWPVAFARHRQRLHGWCGTDRDPHARLPGLHRDRERPGHVRRGHHDRRTPPGARPPLGLRGRRQPLTLHPSRLTLAACYGSRPLRRHRDGGSYERGARRPCERGHANTDNKEALLQQWL
jgi:membrane protease YdiL (CAAX protease family)